MSPYEDPHSPTPARWFPQSAITGLVDSLDEEIAWIDEKCSSGDVPPEPAGADDVQRWTKIAVVCGVVVVAFVMGMTLLGRKLNPDHPITVGSIANLTGLAILMVAIGYFCFGHVFVVRGSRLRRRRQALKEFAASAGSLSPGHALPVSGDSVGRLPWLATELDYVVECDLYGEYRGHKLAVLRCAYTVDKSLTALEDSAGVFATALMSRVQHAAVRRHELEAIVFMDPVAGLPDVFCGAKKQPLNWYFKRTFRSQELNATTSESHWLATSDVARCLERFGPAVQRLFASRPDAILQVMGGHVVLIPRSWDWSRPEMAQDADHLQGHLDWACELVESLATSAAPAAAPSAAVPPDPDSPPALRAAEIPPAPPPPARVEPSLFRKAEAVKPRLALRILAVLGGLFCISVGFIVTTVLLALAIRANNAAGWPTVEGQIVKSEIQVKGKSTPSYTPQVGYEYTVNGQSYRGKRIAIAPIESSVERARIEAVLATYPINRAVRVYYNPRDPDDAVLEPRLAYAGMSLGVGIFTALLAAFGMYLVYRGARRPRTA